MKANQKLMMMGSAGPLPKAVSEPNGGSADTVMAEAEKDGTEGDANGKVRRQTTPNHPAPHRLSLSLSPSVLVRGSDLLAPLATRGCICPRERACMQWSTNNDQNDDGVSWRSILLRFLRHR